MQWIVKAHFLLPQGFRTCHNILMTKEGDTYSSSGVDYNKIDPLKKYAQQRAAKTSPNLLRFGISEVSASRGESAYVWEEQDCYRAFVLEGLGTKNRVADELRNSTGKTYYDTLAQDTVAMITNDLIVVGAQPQVVNAYFAVGDSNWFADEQRAADLVNGWADACNKVGASYGGGESPVLKEIIHEDTIDLAGSAIGIVKPKERLVLGDKLESGDRILLIESNGIHSNGLSIARAVADNLPDRFATPLPDGRLYGEVLLDPTHLYARLVEDLYDAGVDIHYMVNITGHGWRKLMRATQEFSYLIDKIPDPHPVFNFIQEQRNISDKEMYGNFNMGAGFAVFLPERNVETAFDVASQNSLRAINAGHVEDGDKQVVIGPKNIPFSADTLGVR
jgi:phosphoribosylformylglycinamidine cyclo-ligase